MCQWTSTTRIHHTKEEHENQQNSFDANQDGVKNDPNVNDGDKESINNGIERDQSIQKNNINISNDDDCFETTRFFNHINSDHGSDSDYDDGNNNYSDNSSTEGVLSVQKRLPHILSGIQFKGSDKGLDGSAWQNACLIIASMIKALGYLMFTK